MKKLDITLANNDNIDFVIDYALKSSFKKYSKTQFEKLKARYLKRLKSKSYRCLIAAIDDKIVGYVDLDIRKSTCEQTIWVNEIYVKKNYRRLGVGNRLLKQAEKLSIEMGFDFIYLNTEPENKVCLELIKINRYKTVQLILRKKLGYTTN